MSAELLAAGIYIVEEEPRVSGIPSIPTAVLGAVGVTEMGPFERTFTSSLDQWRDLYGGIIAESDLSIAVAGYYLEGGRMLWTKRTVHYSPNPSSEANRTSVKAEVTLTTTGAATQGSATSGNTQPFALAPGDTLSIENDTDSGSPNTVTFDAAAAAVTGSSGTYPTTWTGGETLIVAIDGGANQTITFTSGAQTLAQVIDEINPSLVGGYADDNGGELRITSDKKGTGSRVQIGAGTGNTEMGFAGTEDVSGTGDVADITAVTAAEAETVIEADTTCQVDVVAGAIVVKTPTVGAAGWVEIKSAGSTAHTAGKFDFTAVLDTKQYGSAAGPGDMGKVYARYEGDYGVLKAVVAAATSGDSDEFNLSITKNDIVQESYPNLSTVLTADRYWVGILNTSSIASKLVEVEDLLTGTPPDNRPDNGSYTLTGGNDGLTGLDDNDFIGDPAGKTGLYGLNEIDNLSLLIVPGRATAAVHQAMLTYCEITRKGSVFAVLDPPADLSGTEMVTYVKTTAALKGYSEHGAIYWPRIKILNPDQTEFTSDADGLITIPPSGDVVGAFARTDASRPGGIYEYPAGVDRGKLSRCLGFETNEVLDKAVRDLVYPELINPISVEGNSPRHIDGTRTLKTSGHFPFVMQRRAASHIERSIRIGLLPAKHRRNTRALRSWCTNTSRLYLRQQMALDAFATKKEATAFFVSFVDALNPPSVVAAGQLIGRYGLNLPPPAEYLLLYFSADTRALEAELAESAQGR
jgi:phage tail sheath protein FI